MQRLPKSKGLAPLPAAAVDRAPLAIRLIDVQRYTPSTTAVPYSCLHHEQATSSQRLVKAGTEVAREGGVRLNGQHTSMAQHIYTHKGN
jgi:hypothetical protein